ncbi:hypothetical protein ACVD55_002992 [Vibrio alginolyticus]|uniref:hypothetical protein n=1 Tax=Vibrio diabolicus TaxID=50719 RepID=UPI0029407089|nr:hypothetical protein [Vibrio diabolicus]MDV5085852.1 hypothetical protein [Vibrio diabolicus]
MINLSSLRRIYKSMPHQVLSPLNYIPYSLFCGSTYRNKLKELNQVKTKYIDDYQKDMLINYVNESISYTKYYKDYARSKGFSEIVNVDQLNDFPIIHKDDINSNLDWFVDYRFLNKSFPVSTGGTTGRQTTLLMSNEAYSLEWAFVSKFLKDNGVDINSRRLCLRGTDGIDPCSLFGFNHLYKEMLISPFRLTEENVLSAYKQILKYGARWIHGYPSSVSEFARVLKGLNLKLPNIKHILLVSEKLYPEQEQIISEVFGCNILTFYGMTERVIFAPKYDKRFIPNKLYGFTESIDGELVGTGFINKATRLIRYSTGDHAQSELSSNSGVETIDEILGRWGKEYLVGVNDTKITMTSLNIHSNVLENVIKYQFHQKEKGKCTLLIQPSSSFNFGEEHIVSSEFSKKTGSELIIEPRIVNSIPLTSRGKHQFIVSEL